MDHAKRQYLPCLHECKFFLKQGVNFEAKAERNSSHEDMKENSAAWENKTAEKPVRRRGV
jgi:hypothetical protein